jgi:hypothetical protein
MPQEEHLAVPVDLPALLDKARPEGVYPCSYRSSDVLASMRSLDGASDGAAVAALVGCCAGNVPHAPSSTDRSAIDDEGGEDVGHSAPLDHLADEGSVLHGGEAAVHGLGDEGCGTRDGDPRDSDAGTDKRAHRNLLWFFSLDIVAQSVL